MTLIEAIKSGRMVRMSSIISAVYVDPNNYSFNKNEILSNDWEIEEEKIELTADEIKEAIYSNNDLSRRVSDIYANRVLESLGFKS